MIARRRSGVLLHITSLPSRFGLGDLGPTARAFADWLHEAGQQVWQVLPLCPTATWAYNDPYHSISAFAGNPLLISPEDLVELGLLTPAEVEAAAAEAATLPAERVDFQAATTLKQDLLTRAFSRFAASADPRYRVFLEEHGWWLEDYALFASLKTLHELRPWTEWPADLRDRKPKALAAARKELVPQLDFIRFQQYLFERQWSALRAYCAERGLQLFGDMAIYVDHDSTEVWTNPRYFKLQPDKRPAFVSGVPPDYFSATGQLWGTPIYDWDALRAGGFDWWLRRIGRNLALYDLLRIDHFRGLVAYWEVKAGEPTAMYGRWVDAPVYEFFSAVRRRFPALPVIAEDLGFITPDVREAIATLGFPGMAILQFAWGSDSRNPFLPHNIKPASVAYVGTHDNNTARGWLAGEASPAELERLWQYLGHQPEPADFPRAMMRLALSTPAELAVVTAQDLAGLGSEARMNRPGHLAGNWEWRLAPGALGAPQARHLAELTRLFGR